VQDEQQKYWQQEVGRQQAGAGEVVGKPYVAISFPKKNAPQKTG